LKDSCQAKLDESKFVKNLKVVDWKRTSLNETDIALQLMKYGPFSIALNAELLQFYFGGIFDPLDSLCNPKNLNHAVLLVGWGVHQSHFFGKQPYWIVKNSWGKGQFFFFKRVATYKKYTFFSIK
jgi:cathepsin F